MASTSTERGSNMTSVKLVMRRQFGQERLKFLDKDIDDRWSALGHRIVNVEALALLRALGLEVEIEDPA